MNDLQSTTIYIDDRQSAILHTENDKIFFYTLQEAVVARAHLPPEQKNSATIEVSGTILSASEIARLYRRQSIT